MIINSSIRKYEVLFGKSLIDSFSKEIVPDSIIFIDQKVYNLLDQDTKKIIDKNKYILIKANEYQKSYSQIRPLIESVIKYNFRKSNKLICNGGGITQDITAFISSIIFRGVEWVFFPTTLLSQADSCIGGKTSINIGKYKNQIGNFYPPSKIIILPKFLRTLSELDFKSGLGEMLHFYLVSGENDFNFYSDNYQKSFNDDKILLELIKRNLDIKKRFIEKDEFDLGERQLLNYGHSFGHAIESITNYKIQHGIAVSYGMDIANYISEKLGYIDTSLRKKIKKIINQITSGTDIKNISVNNYTKILSNDKKNIDSSYRLILTKGIGKMEVVSIKPSHKFSNWLEEYFNTLN